MRTCCECEQTVQEYLEARCQSLTDKLCRVMRYLESTPDPHEWDEDNRDILLWWAAHKRNCELKGHDW